MPHSTNPSHQTQTSRKNHNYSVFTSAESTSPTPDLAVPNMGYRGYLANVTGNLVNFYNANDFALATGNLATFTHVPFLWWIDTNWEANEVGTKPDYFGLTSRYYYYPGATDPLQAVYRYASPYGYVTDPQEAMSFVARPRSKAVGALAGVSGKISSEVDLTGSFGFRDQRDEHSAEFNWNIQRLGGPTGFYHTLLNKLFPPE